MSFGGERRYKRMNEVFIQMALKILDLTNSVQIINISIEREKEVPDAESM